jgi:hypothetical protein
MGLVAGCLTASGATLNFTGNLPNPNALFEVQFTLSTQANLTMQTTSVVGGGFDAVLWLFDSTGTTQIAKNDPMTNVEAMISEPNFPAGTYLLILSAFDQHYCVANTICNNVVYANTGWSYNGLVNFGGRGSNFGVSITADQPDNPTENTNFIDSAPARAIPSVPEPGSATLLLAGAGLLALRRWGPSFLGAAKDRSAR